MTQFAPGESGNPAGRPRGVGDKRVALRALLEPHAESLVKKAVELAEGGDTAALRLCVERLIPPWKAESLAEPLACLRGVGGLEDQGRAVIDGIANGEISAMTGTALLSALMSHARLIETTELERRIAALERGKSA